MRQVDERGKLVRACELELRREALVLGGRHVVVADLADRDHAVLLEVAGQQREHAVDERRIVGLARVHRERAEVADAELARAKPLPAEQRQEVVLERADVRARLTDPERRLDDRGNARRGHRLVVVGRARRHVDVRIEELHRSTSFASSGTARPAARRSLANASTMRTSSSVVRSASPWIRPSGAPTNSALRTIWKNAGSGKQRAGYALSHAIASNTVCTFVRHASIASSTNRGGSGNVARMRSTAWRSRTSPRRRRLR